MVVYVPHAVLSCIYRFAGAWHDYRLRFGECTDAFNVRLYRLIHPWYYGAAGLLRERKGPQITIGPNRSQSQPAMERNWGEAYGLIGAGRQEGLK